MKNLRKVCAGVALLLALSIPALAGEITGGRAPGDISGAPAAGNISGEPAASNGFFGYILVTITGILVGD
jgi:hypothetical protein